MADEEYYDDEMMDEEFEEEKSEEGDSQICVDCKGNGKKRTILLILEYHENDEEERTDAEEATKEPVNPFQHCRQKYQKGEQDHRFFPGNSRPLGRTLWLFTSYCNSRIA